MTAEYKSMIPHLTVLAKYAAKHAVAFCGVESNAIVEAMEEYAEQRIRENYVEKEFVEWIGLKYGFHEIALREIDMKWLYPLNEGKEYTLDELYDYWNTNIKSKQEIK